MARTLWISQDSVIWEAALQQYDEQRDRQNNSKILTPLDLWYMNQLPNLLSKQKFISQSQLSQLMKWKLARGQNRPSLQKFVDSLSDALVQKTSKEAFAILDDDPGKALDRLATLKGIGPATASAILSAYSASIPFLSDEALIAVNLPGKYTKAAFLRLLEESTEICKTLNSQGVELQWNPKLLEKALFSEEKRFKAQAEEPKTLKRMKEHRLKETPPSKKRKTTIK